MMEVEGALVIYGESSHLDGGARDEIKISFED